MFEWVSASCTVLYKYSNATAPFQLCRRAARYGAAHATSGQQLQILGREGFLHKVSKNDQNGTDCRLR